MIHLHLQGSDTDTIMKITIFANEICNLQITNIIKDSAESSNISGSYDYDCKLFLDIILPKVFTTLNSGGLINHIANFSYDPFVSQEAYMAVEILITLNECIAGTLASPDDPISTDKSTNFNLKDWN